MQLSKERLIYELNGIHPHSFSSQFFCIGRRTNSLIVYVSCCFTRGGESSLFAAFFSSADLLSYGYFFRVLQQRKKVQFQLKVKILFVNLPPHNERGFVSHWIFYFNLNSRNIWTSGARIFCMR